MESASTELQGNKVMVTAGVMLAGLMAFLDISIVNVALSDIRASFGTPLDEIGWVSTGYMMANVVVIPITGFLQKRFGYRRYFFASILLFVAASALCGLAWSLPSLVAFRILQGVGGGAIIPTANAILLARYPREEHGMASGLFGLGAVCGPLLGPTVGGYLIQISSWHFIFLVNVPIGIVAAYLVSRYLEEPHFVAENKPIDGSGLGLLAVGMASLQYVLEEGHRADWFESKTIVVLSVLAVAGLATFVVHELETAFPIVDLRVFADRSYAAGTGVNFLLGVALFSGTYLFSLYCGVVMRYDALTTGLVTLGPGLLQVFLMPMIGKYGGKVDPRALLLLGVAMMSTSLWMNAHLSGEMAFGGLVRPNFFRFVSTGFLFIPLTLVTLSGLPADKRGNAAGLFNLTRELGGSVGTAILSTLLDSRAKLHAARIAEAVTATAPATQLEIAKTKVVLGAKIADATGGAYAVIAGRIAREATAWAFRDGFVVLLAAFACSVVFIAMLRPAKPGVVIEGVH